MATHPGGGVGHRVTSARRARRMSQEDLARAAHVSLSMICKIEQGSSVPSDDTLDAVAAALDVDPSRLLNDSRRTDSRVHAVIPALSAAIAAYDVPDDGPPKPLLDLHTVVAQAVNWRLTSQYTRLSRVIPSLLCDLARALHSTTGGARCEVAALLAAAYRAADAVAYKFGYHDLSARLIELMRWAADHAEDPLLVASAAYVRTETFFAAGVHAPEAYAAGLRSLEAAIDAVPHGDDPQKRAGAGALHMRAAVVAARAGNADAATVHLNNARQHGDRITEGVYGTVFGPSSVRIHEVSVAVSLGDPHLTRALDVAREWAPPRNMPAERRSGFYIELGRAQRLLGLWDDAFESIRVARRIAPQHTREHPWVREDATRLRTHYRSNPESLLAFAEWVRAT